MRRCRSHPVGLLILIVWFAAWSPVEAQSLHQQIDQQIQSTPDYTKNASRLASDAEFLRRVTLDLTGTIPSSSDAKAFLNDKTPDKRTKLIDRLLASPEYARYMQMVFDIWLMDRRRDVRVGRPEWENFLRTAFQENKPYDQFVRELLSSDGSDSKTRAQAKFFLDRDSEPNLVTKDLGRLFLGKNLQCAQCHDHPNIGDYYQADYYGIQAFLNRTFLYPDVNAPTAVLAEKAEGEVNFSSVFDKKKLVHNTEPKLPGLKQIKDPKFDKGKEYKVAPAKNVKPVPVYSRREQLANAMTSPENEAFRRTAANRFWALMFGRGLVEPLDLDHSNNPPSHPELLKILTKAFAEKKFDVKWYLKEIALSQSYQRSSEVPSQVQDVDATQYWVAPLKPLNGEQFAFAILQATGFTDSVRLTLGKDPTEEKVFAQLTGKHSAIARKFASLPGQQQGTDLDATIDQTLFLKNSSVIRDPISPRKGSLLERLLPMKDDGAIAEEMFLSILTRLPSDEEKKVIVESLKQSKNRTETLTEEIWAILASTEFRFNH
jgi:hypothetical protein